MKPIKTTALFLSIILLLTACTLPPQDENISAQETDIPRDEQEFFHEDAYSLMIYMCGSDLESKSGAASDNITEMLSAEIPENVRVFIQTGGSIRWHGHDIPAENSCRYEVKNGELVLLAENPPVNMGLSSSLYDFLLWGENLYPAEHRGIILWDHGGGSINGVCTDEQFFNDTLSLTELGSALEKMSVKAGRKYEFIGFDACLMATYDTACILEEYSNFMIASEDLEPLSGWDYETVLTQMGSDSFYSDVLLSYSEKHSEKSTYTLSVTDLSGVYEFDNIISEFTESMTEDISIAGKALSQCMEFGINTGLLNSTDLFDLGSIADSLGIDHDISSFVQSVNGSSNNGACGISIYFPSEPNASLEEYESICQNSSYFDFLSSYLSYQHDSLIEFIDAGYDNNDFLSFTLTDDSLQFVHTVGYIVYGPEDDENANSIPCLGADIDIDFESGVYTVNFRGNWVFLDDTPLHTYIYRIEDTHTIYSTPVVINDEVCYLLFTYDKPTQKITVEGYVVIGDTTSRIYDVADGTQLYILHERNSTDDSVEFYIADTLVWQDSTNPTVKKLEAGRYMYVPYIVDIFGSFYQGNIATVYFDGEHCEIEQISE